MEPDIRYCTTRDGVRIAYTVTGQGPVFVSMIDPFVSHVQLEWSNIVNKRVLEEEARHFTLVRFDPRGAGLSERVAATSFDDTVLDIETVVDHLQLSTFTLHANTSVSQSAIAFAARHPDRVSRMILIDGYARSADMLATPQVAAFLAAAANDWETATETIAAIAFGPGREESRLHGKYVRACIGRDEYLAVAAQMGTVDVTPAAATLRMPVLLVRHTGMRSITDQMTHDLASAIPDARLVTLNGMWLDDVERLMQRITAFVYEDAEPPVKPTARAASSVRTVLFTDLVGHTEMMQRLGDAKGREVLREHERITRATLKQYGGTEIKTDGDSFMVSFGSVTQAMDCAIALQRAFASHTASMPEPLHVRVGLNAGEPIEEDGDLFGSTVILASRIAAHAGPGEVLIPEPLRHLLSGKSYVYADRGETMLKGFEDAVRLYEVRWRDE